MSRHKTPCWLWGSMLVTVAMTGTPIVILANRITPALLGIPFFLLWCSLVPLLMGCILLLHNRLSPVPDTDEEVKQ